MLFEVSGVVAPLWLPPLVAFVISYFTSMVGVSGAFLLLPFQMSVLGYVSPSVSATNLVFNLVAIPSGVWRYASEGRMNWPLARLIALGTVPGLFAGWWLRLHWLADPRSFKVFVAAVLAWLAVRLLRGRRRGDAPSATPADTSVALPARAIVLLSLGIGVIGGAYGIGGGALMAPVLVAVFGLSVHVVAGAALFGTFLASLAGVSIYQFLPGPAGVATRPDWLLGMLFGLGGAAGMYLGARTQKHVPQRILALGLALLLGGVAAGYVIQFFA